MTPERERNGEGQLEGPISEGEGHFPWWIWVAILLFDNTIYHRKIPDMSYHAEHPKYEMLGLSPPEREERERVRGRLAGWDTRLPQLEADRQATDRSPPLGCAKSHRPPPKRAALRLLPPGHIAPARSASGVFMTQVISPWGVAG